MKKLFVTIFLSLIIITNVFAWRDNEMEVRVYYSNQYELDKLQDLGLEGDIYPNGEALLYVVSSELQDIKNIDLRFKIEKDDVKAFAETFWQSQDHTRETYHSMQEIIDLADSLVTAFPSICEKHVYGYSVDGVELGALKITDNVTLDENEAEVMFDSGIHGDEIGGPENCIRFARDLCTDYGIDPTITDLVDSREIWIYYMVNPDGRDPLVRYNSNGVDCNRDASYMWDAWGGSPGPASQPESKALRDITFERNFVVHTTYHSGTEYISCPWSYRADQAPDFSHIIDLAGVYSSTSTYANMEYGQGCTGMYPINGSTKDTNYGAMGSISWSMEISYAKQPPTSQIMTYYNHNKPAMLAMVEYAGYGLEGVVTDTNTGDPVTANVFINDYFPCYTDANAGDYHKYVLPGTYDITIVANGYETETITGVTVNANSATTTDFVMQPLDGHYVYKVRSSQIPDNNSADEGDTPGVIGAPDNRNYSIGKNGWIVVDMQDPVPDGPGNDIRVYEGDASVEEYSVFGGETIDGPWYFIGDGAGTAEFDLATGNMIEAQFIKITDDGDGTANIADAGFDLDAVEGIAENTGVYLALIGTEIDEVIGNNNGYIDPGESIDILVTVRNNGSQAANGVSGTITTSSSYVTIESATDDFGDLDPGDEGTGMFSFTVDAATPSNESFDLDLAITANNGSYSVDFEIPCQVGVSIEDFESNGFETFEWEFEGNANWIISPDSYEGSYSGQSGDINDNQSSALNLTVEVVADGELSFFRKVSSEEGWDYLIFFIDNIQLGSWSGTSGWVEETYSVTAGVHTFKWEYTKDTSVSNGSDCGWVDYIVFPPLSIINPFDPPVELEAEIIDYNSAITVTWNGTDRSKDQSRDLLGFNIYFDGVFVEYVSTCPVTFNGPFAEGDYIIGVSAVYDEGESEIVEITATVILDPPDNLEALSSGDDIILAWDPPTPVRGIVEYMIYRDGLEIGTTTETTYTDPTILTGNYTYGVSVIFDGGYESEAAEINIEHTDASITSIPNITELSGNYPNPFNPSTNISFSTTNQGQVSLRIYNMRGQLVKTLLNEDLEAAYHNITWNGKDNLGNDVSSGIYFYNLKTENYNSTRKMILMK